MKKYCSCSVKSTFSNERKKTRIKKNYFDDKKENTKDGKVKNINEIVNMLTDDLKSKICVEKEFKDVLTNLSAWSVL